MEGGQPAGVTARRRIGRTGVPTALLVGLLGGALGLCALGPSGLAAQTIQGVLLDGETRSPVSFGLILMFTEEGDSVTATVSDTDGAFRLSSAEPGGFVLRASAFGYAESQEGVFELGPGGVLDVRYAMRAVPLPIDEIVVTLDRPATLHHLVRNGFVTRLQRGLGLFVTPYDIEQSAVRSTEQLLAGLPGLRVGTAYPAPSGPLPAGEVAVLNPRPDVGESVLIQGPGGWCAPTLYVDGARVHYDPSGGFTLESVAGIDAIEAIEVYRRPAEIPVEYRAGADGGCGVLVAWTRTGLAPGQRPSERASDGPVSLPRVSADGPPPVPGERVRVALALETGTRADTDPIEGVLLDVSEVSVVVRDRATARTLSLPPHGVSEIQVRRARPDSYALVRGGLAGGGVFAFTWGGLALLCEWSECNGSVEKPWIAATIAGSIVGWLVYRRGPGEHWVRTSLPAVSAGERGVDLSWTVRR